MRRRSTLFPSARVRCARVACTVACALYAAGCDGGGISSTADGGPGRDGRVPMRDAGPPPPPPPPVAECTEPAMLVDTSAPDHTIGDGTPASCTEMALRNAVAAGGTIAFDCGDGPAIITLTSALVPTRDVTIDGGGFVTLDGGGTTRHVTMDTGNFEATTPHLRLQRITLRNGRASGPELEGGGGAIFYRGGRVTAVEVTFENNRAMELGPDVAGGAIYGIGAGETVVVRSRFVGNAAANGGAIGALGSAITIVSSVLHGNSATGWGANFVEGGVQMGMGGNGGAVSMDGEGRDLRVCGSTFTSNTSGAFGGAIFRTGYATEVNEIHLSTFDDNEARDGSGRTPALSSGGGALYLQGVGVVITRTTISNNRAPGSAGLWVLGHGATPGTLRLENSTLYGNRTFPHADFTMRGIGGALTIGDDTTGSVLNCTIVQNEAQFASGILNASPLTIRNTIIANVAENEWTPLNCMGSAYAMPPGMGEHNVQWPTGKSMDDMDCTPGIARMDPMMGPLGDGGGPTATSRAMASGLPRGTMCPSLDQRGEPRDTSDCAIGAVEP